VFNLTVGKNEELNYLTQSSLNQLQPSPACYGKDDARTYRLELQCGVLHQLEE